MCSILGYIGVSYNKDEIESLNSTLSHRGPDNSSVSQSKMHNNSLFLAHNRLSIQDLNQNANQPMESGRFSIVFNGEIYNHLELREKLSFKDFKTHSDTETLLQCFIEFGVDKTLEKLIGMFAIALFDNQEDKLYLMRDRLGIKPLYYTFQEGEFAFASELKGIPEYLKDVTSDKALIQFTSLGYIPSNNSYYKNIHKLKPAHYLVFNGKSVEEYQYWELPKEKSSIGFNEAVSSIEELLKSSINYRLLSDLEVGAFLSGGVDSSLVCALMQEQSTKKIKTFSIGFDNPKYNEAPYAKAVAKHLDTEHHEFIFTPDDVLELLEDFDYYYDEPFGDASALPTMLLAKKTKEHVTVALSGDGGDELFLGYERYFFTQNYYQKLQKVPSWMRGIISSGMKILPDDRLKKMSYPVGNLSLENLYGVISTSVKPWELTKIFSDNFIKENFGSTDIGYLDLLDTKESFNEDEIIDSLSRVDIQNYLSEDILTKVDRASMKYALEARVPLLDHRLVELAASIPTDIKLKYGPKSILKEILYKYVPKELIERPKRGFSVPLQHWFRDELHDVLMAKIDNLDEKFNKAYVNKLVDLHMNHGHNYEYIFWNLLRLR